MFPCGRGEAAGNHRTVDRLAQRLRLVAIVVAGPGVHCWRMAVDLRHRILLEGGQFRIFQTLASYLLPMALYAQKGAVGRLDWI